MIAALRKSHGASRTLTRPIGRKAARIIAFFICGQVSLAVVPRNAEASATLSVNPSSFIFGNVPVGSASYQAFTLTNSGSVAITISNATAAGTGFGVGGKTFPLTLAPGGSCTLIAGFAPTSQGLTVGVMWIVSPQMSYPLAIMMVGSGLSGAPVIMTQPASKSIFVGRTATFSITASGAAPLTYQWRKNGIAIAGATAPIYTTPLATGSDNGEQFTVIVSNSAGGVTSATAFLTVNAAVAPSITAEPVGRTITAGQTAIFSVVASGTAPLAYQWYKNGATISGATSSSYSTPAETTPDTGAKFNVAVTNSFGGVTSNAATLTVTAALGPLNASASTLAFGNVNLGGASNRVITFTNSGASNITVSSANISGPGFTATGISAGLIVSPGQTVSSTATFAPAATGSVTGTVSVVSNASNSPMSISLSGTGVQPSHSVTLTWNPSTSAVIGYNVYRGTNSAGPYSKINSSLDATTTFTDAAVLAGQSYCWIVTAIDSSNVESVYSNEVLATIPTP